MLSGSGGPEKPAVGWRRQERPGPAVPGLEKLLRALYSPRFLPVLTAWASAYALTATSWSF